MSPRKGFDADGGAFTLSCFALLYRAAVCVAWCGVLGLLGPVGAGCGCWQRAMGNGDWSLKWALGVGPFEVGLFP